MFSDVLESGAVTSVNVDTTQSDKLLRLLDTVVIKLEGGTDEDLKVLDEKPIEHRPLEPLKEIIAPVAVVPETKPANAITAAKSGDEDDEVQQPTEAVNEPPAKSNDAVEVVASNTKRTTSGSSSSSHSSSSSSSSDDEDSHDADEELR